MTKAEKIKYLLAPAIGFGIGGALWGWRWFEFWEETKRNDFLALFIIVLAGILATFSLVLFLKNTKALSKIFVIGGGGIVWLIIFYVCISSFLLLAAIFPPGIMAFYLLFGLIIALFYGLTLKLMLKIKVWPVAWRGMVGFVLAPIFGSIFGVIGGNLFGSFLLGDVVTFSLAGIILGLFLGWGLYKGQKVKT